MRRREARPRRRARARARAAAPRVGQRVLVRTPSTRRAARGCARHTSGELDAELRAPTLSSTCATPCRSKQTGINSSSRSPRGHAGDLADGARPRDCCWTPTVTRPWSPRRRRSLWSRQRARTALIRRSSTPVRSASRGSARLFSCTGSTPSCTPTCRARQLSARTNAVGNLTVASAPPNLPSPRFGRSSRHERRSPATRWRGAAGAHPTHRSNCRRGCIGSTIRTTASSPILSWPVTTVRRSYSSKTSPGRPATRRSASSSLGRSPRPFERFWIAARICRTPSSFARRNTATG